ncbi:NAD-dependent dehydratase [Leuconostoc litchii]|uniref:NAD(P)-dependent oxidoreductase n=1 Tax=Leuconostoc litchii TaxID=1981069 RepID=A0A6P2CND5_9LACO|nr:NAD(P)-binding oxidoreductase [Leuconostoc litchii]TYC47440.1 NAD(P)-dependent oxidoreductase [Leuconostoc litchii]GMA69457.1 NAD-dependent dehydratase [Leuconostoc litchii]
MTKNILILGANGQIAKLVVDTLANSDTNLTLTSLHARPEKHIKALDATEENSLVHALKDIDIVYANIGAEGRQKNVANALVNAMHKTGVKRLIWIATIGIYNELPPHTADIWRNILGTTDNENTYMGDQAAAAKRIENSQLEYTIIRPNELTDDNKMQQLNVQTEPDEIIVGRPITRTSVAEFISQIILDPSKYISTSVAISSTK